MAAVADIVVVGGGIVGAAIAQQITTRSDRRVVVCDKGSGPGEGSTGASSSIVRVRYSDPEVVRLAVEAQGIWNNWQEFVGLTEIRAPFVRTGGLWIDDGVPLHVEREAARLTAAGAVVAVVEHTDVVAPGVSRCVEPLDLETDDDHVCRNGEAFLYEPGAGHADPVGALEDLLESATSAGADIRFGSPVSELIRSDHGPIGVVLGDGERIDAPLVVNAAGPWAGEIDRLAQVDHGWELAPTRIQTTYVEVGAQAANLPIVFDAPGGVYLRPSAHTVLVGGTRERDEREVISPDSLIRQVDSPFRDRMLASLAHRWPSVRGGATSGVAGLYTINRVDVHPIVGPTSLDGYWVAAGFSGHGFKLAPVIGAMVARAVTGVEGPHDPTAGIDLFALDRDPFEPTARSVLA